MDVDLRIFVVMFMYSYCMKKLSAITSWSYSSGSVRYDMTQSLTDTQKNAALSNIGSGIVIVPYSLLTTALSGDMLDLVTNAKGILLVDAPTGYGGGGIFWKATRSTTTDKFIFFNGDYTVVKIEFNRSTGFLSNLSSYDLRTGAVRYDVIQSLSTVYQSNVRDNIGVKSPNELLADDDFIAQLKTKLGIA